MYAKVSKKGRVTIPKPIRDQLRIDHESAVLFVVENGEVKIKGLPKKSAEALAGSLNKYVSQFENVPSGSRSRRGKAANRRHTTGISRIGRLAPTQ